MISMNIDKKKNKRTKNSVYLFNTYQRKKRLFVPLEPGNVKMYTCGPTVYDYPHIGNLRAYIVADILRRTLEFNGYKVKHVINITDVGHLSSDADLGEDKVELSARRQKRSAFEIAELYTRVFKQNLLGLNIKPPSVWSKATDHIGEQITLIKKLEKDGYTYLTSDGVYFDTSKVSHYGRLARLDAEGIKPGARVNIREKRNPTDFALWKFSPQNKKRQMEWKSPWGTGFPGWHIECSAMAMKYLGETIDIHTGGIDHIPIHHTNEIAQSEAATGKQFVRYWTHIAFLTVNGKKMAKSEHNFITLQNIIERGYDPLVFRYLVLTSHYRAGLNFTWQSLQGAQEALFSLREKISNFRDRKDSPNKQLTEEFKSRINNDLNTPQAIALLWEVVNSSLTKQNRKTILEFDKALQLNLGHSLSGEVPEEIKVLVQRRETLREEKKWDESDRVRQEIIKRGYEIRDTSARLKIIRKGL